MAAGKLKIDMEAMGEQAVAVRQAVDAYKKSGKKPFSKETDQLSGMNTDFLARFGTMLVNLDDGNGKLTEALEEIAVLTQKSLELLEQKDRQSASEMGFKRKP